jgi:hypothetical protein
VRIRRPIRPERKQPRCLSIDHLFAFHPLPGRG